MRTLTIIYMLLLNQIGLSQTMTKVCDATPYIPTSTDIDNPYNAN